MRSGLGFANRILWRWRWAGAGWYMPTKRAPAPRGGGGKAHGEDVRQGVARAKKHKAARIYTHWQAGMCPPFTAPPTAQPNP
jgi:hypothetical protein